MGLNNSEKVPERIGQYQCVTCKGVRRITFEEEVHQDRANNSPNGLVVYSDIHQCSGSLGVNNLQVDYNCSLRGIETLSLPTQREPITVTSIPAPTQPMGKKSFRLNPLQPEDQHFRFILIDEGLKVKINLGNVQSEETPLSIIRGDLGIITLDYYPSKTAFTELLEVWLNKLLNLMEILPPSRLGNILEVFRFIHTNRNEDINSDYSYFKIIKTILTAHEINIKPQFNPDRFDWLAVTGSEKYGATTASSMIKMLVDIEMDPDQPLQSYIARWNEESINIINLLLLMENEKIISLIRPIGHWV